MTFSPEGPRSSGSGSGGYGSPYSADGGRPTEPGAGGYGAGFPPENARPAAPGYGGFGPTGPSNPPGPSGQTYGAPVQQTPSGQYNPPLASDRQSQLPRVLTLVVAVLGVVNFLVGLAGQYEVPGEAVNFFFVQTGDPTSVALLLAAGLVAAAGLLPRQANTIGIAAGLAVTGWLVLVFQSFNTGDAGPIGASIELGIGAIVVLVLGFVQSLLAVAATLFGAGILKAPQPKPASYGQQNFQGTYGQQAPGYGQQSQSQSYSGYGQNLQPNYGGPNQPTPGQSVPGQSAPNQSAPNQSAPNQGYVPPAYTGPSQNQPNQNTTGSLGYPVGSSKQDGPPSGLTGPAGQSSPYSQQQYGQPPVGSSGYGAPQHAVPSETGESEPDTPPYSAPTQAFEQSTDDKK